MLLSSVLSLALGACVGERSLFKKEAGALALHKRSCGEVAKRAVVDGEFRIIISACFPVRRVNPLVALDPRF